MATVNKGYAFGATETVTAAKLAALVDNASISNIVATDISSNAITDVKINDVSGSKFTTLSATPSGAGQFPVSNINYTGVPTDINSISWTDYSGVSTIIGWSTFSLKEIAYKKIGKIIFFTFRIQGVSNSTSTSFTLPANAVTGFNSNFCIYGQDNSSELTSPSLGGISSGSNIITFSKNSTGTVPWTIGGIKLICGQSWYEAA